MGSFPKGVEQSNRKHEFGTEVDSVSIFEEHGANVICTAVTSIFFRTTAMRGIAGVFRIGLT